MFSMLAIITDSKEIKAGLFPGPGQHASTKNGGGKPKTDHQFAIAKALWEKESFWPKGAALTTAVHTKICNKIKNCLRMYVYHSKFKPKLTDEL